MNMKHYWMLGAVLALLAAGGCRTAKTIDGRDCYPLTEKQQRQVIEVARDSLLHGERKRSDKFTPAEEELIRITEPDFRIRYTGDYAGEVACTWELPEKSVRVEARGRFDDMSDPYEFGWRMSIFYRGPEVIYRSVPGHSDTEYRPPAHPKKPVSR